MVGRGWGRGWRAREREREKERERERERFEAVPGGLQRDSEQEGRGGEKAYKSLILLPLMSPGHVVGRVCVLPSLRNRWPGTRAE